MTFAAFRTDYTGEPSNLASGRPNVPPDRWWLGFKFQLLVHAFIFVIPIPRHLCLFGQIVAFLGVLVKKIYGDELREMFGYEEHPYIMAAIVLVGLLNGFFIAIICDSGGGGYGSCDSGGSSQTRGEGGYQ